MILAISKCIRTAFCCILFYLCWRTLHEVIARRESAFIHPNICLVQPHPPMWMNPRQSRSALYIYEHWAVQLSIRQKISRKGPFLFVLALLPPRSSFPRISPAMNSLRSLPTSVTDPSLSLRLPLPNFYRFFLVGSWSLLLWIFVSDPPLRPRRPREDVRVGHRPWIWFASWIPFAFLVHFLLWFLGL